jgi:hypothetical protein
MSNNVKPSQVNLTLLPYPEKVDPLPYEAVQQSVNGEEYPCASSTSNRVYRCCEVDLGLLAGNIGTSVLAATSQLHTRQHTIGAGVEGISTVKLSAYMSPLDRNKKTAF